MVGMTPGSVGSDPTNEGAFGGQGIREGQSSSLTYWCPKAASWSSRNEAEAPLIQPQASCESLSRLLKKGKEKPFLWKALSPD